MYIKLINPKVHGSAAYANKGSSLQMLNYLVQELKKEGHDLSVFFNQDSDGLKPEQVMAEVDNNVKGLAFNEAKFYSLIISPSGAELEHIKNDEQLLKDYTRQVMELYAQNFNLKDGRRLSSADLVWGATIHQDRSYRGTDQEVLAGNARVGDKRAGLQTHVHIIVSARDREQKVTLNPNGRKSRFDLIGWQRKSGQQFEKQFHYTAQEKEKVKARPRDASRDPARARRIGERVEVLNRNVPKSQRLEEERVKEIAFNRNYDKTFYRSLNRLELKAQQGRPIDNAYYLLTTGKEHPVLQVAPARTLIYAFQRALNAGAEPATKTEEIGGRKGRKKGEIEID
jgi:hypothetical protein